MILNETVLVLGAGASMPYGYPSGKQLRNMLLSPGLFNPVIEMGWIDMPDAEDFCDTFLFSAMKSIDAFLSLRGSHTLPSGKSIEEVGKIGISLALRPGKNIDGLFQRPEKNDTNPTDRNDHWYEYLWDRLTKGLTSANVESFAKNRLTVVTFNYDLSLEHFLYRAMCSSFGIPGSDVDQILSAIRFIHVYGKLSGNPFSDGFNHDFDFGRDFRKVRADVGQIQVIDERRTDASSEFSNASAALAKAERICFLGFGFDATNVDRLGLANLLSERALSHDSSTPRRIEWPKLAASTFGFLPGERSALVNSMITPLIQKNPSLHVQASWQPIFANAFGDGGDCKSEELLRRTQILS